MKKQNDQTAAMFDPNSDQYKAARTNAHAKIVAAVTPACVKYYHGTMSGDYCIGKDGKKITFDQLMASKNIGKFFAVCGPDKGISKTLAGTQEICKDDVFRANIPGNIVGNNNVRVQMIEAIKLAQEYARIKYNGMAITCDSNYRTLNSDDYIKCTSTDGTTFFEFGFDSVNSSIDNDIKEGVLRGVCTGIFGTKATPDLYVPGYQGASTFHPAWCDADQATCARINESMQKFGYDAKFLPANELSGQKYGNCQINYNDVSSTNALAKIDGIENYKFYKSMQFQSVPALTVGLQKYVRQVNPAWNLNCVSGFRTLHTNDAFNPKDDVLRCYVYTAGNENDQSKPIDFVFDDLNEFIDTIAHGGLSGMSCIADGGGTYDGKKCWGLTQAQCEGDGSLSAKIKAAIPGSSGAKWDKDLGTCVLADATNAANLNKAINIGTVAAVATGAIIMAIPSGGSSMVLVWAAVGTVAEQVGTNWAESSGTEFLSVAQQCLNMAQPGAGACADDLLAADFQRIADISGNFLPAQADAIDTLIAKLIKLLPANAQIYNKTLEAAAGSWTSPSYWAHPENAMIGLGRVLQFAATVKALGNFAGQGIQLIKTKNALTDGLKIAAEKWLVTSGKEVAVATTGDAKVYGTGYAATYPLPK
ncbi:MAG: hypothetical protein FWC51_04905 [Proteobacteria bacterium]|nr:hypothetical protein [Pseudomonadota bacterium]